jgi:hypothetical protein
MASIEPNDSIDVADGANPDAVAPSVRIWRISPIRLRSGTVPPDFTDNGNDIYLLGDDDDDTVEPSVLSGLGNSLRNGLKRTYTDEGSPSLWAEPAPQSYDSAGSSVGTVGNPTGPPGAADTTIDLGVAATHSIVNNGDFPLVVRPVISIVGARYESPLATLRANLTITADAVVTNVSRDLFFGYGGSNTIALPAVNVATGGSYQLDAELQLIYRQAVAEAFEFAVAGAQVVFQIIEYTSAGS